MKIDEIQIGKNYKLDIQKSVAKIRIYKDPFLSEAFLQKHQGKTWGDLHGMEIQVIDFTYGVSGLRSGVKFHLLSDPRARWAAIYPQFLKTLPEISTTCNCNLWIQGCQCGVFKAENSKENKKNPIWKHIGAY